MSPRDTEQGVDKNTSKQQSATVHLGSSENIENIAFGSQAQQPQLSETQENPQQSVKGVVPMKNYLFGYEMPFDVISASYAGLVALGGVMGYVKASQFK